MPFQGSEVAIVGISCRFPGAPSVDAFWTNLTLGVESIRFFEDPELIDAGVDRQTLESPGYVKATPLLDDHDAFDAAFFGLTPKDAALMDPQHRVFLECSWTALEHAGYAPNAIAGRVGVYGSASYNSYLIECLKTRPDIEEVEGADEVMVGNSPSYMPTRVSYKLDLRGPSVHVETACSSSLTAVHLACQALLLDECDVSLAGGVSVRVPQVTGYQHEPGMIFSNDGHCRAFSEDATGMLFGSGVGVVVLKRLSDALADGDTIYAIIRGTALNNDGSAKMGFTAPSVEGQVRVIRAALATEDIAPGSIGYVEAHGTGTSLGDAVEWEALEQVYGTERRCGVGSVKTNIGHLSSAAGLAGLIKATLALHHKQIPPTLHFRRRRSEDVGGSASHLYVVDHLEPFESVGEPRRAAVTSLGVGGTNAHLILEEAPPAPRVADRRSHHLLKISARTEAALTTLEASVGDRARDAALGSLGDLAFTLGTGRAELPVRNYLVVGTNPAAPHARTVLTGARRSVGAPAPRVVFMVPGNGSQYLGMCHDLYVGLPVFRQVLDDCDQTLQKRCGIKLVETLYGPNAAMPAESGFIQPALFAVEYALARTLMSWGIRPAAMIGHSLGEYVCACLAGVFSVEDGLEIVAARGALMDHACRGKMLSVVASAERMAELVSPGISIAGVNAAASTTVSGTAEAIDGFKVTLERAGVEYLELPVTHAFHSDLTEAIFERFEQVLRRVRLAEPTLPYISNLTGNWILPDQPTSPAYWLRHARDPVMFAAGVATLKDVGRSCLVEVGPGAALGGFAAGGGHTVISAVRHRRKTQHDIECLLASVGKCWQDGVDVDWDKLAGGGDRRRIDAPTYPFERTRHWYPAARSSAQRAASLPPPPSPVPTSLPQRRRVSLWIPEWEAHPARSQVPPAAEARVAIVVGYDDLATRTLAEAAAAGGARVVTAICGTRYEWHASSRAVINLAASEDFRQLLRDASVGGHDSVVWIHTLGVGEHQRQGLADHVLLAYQSVLEIVRAITALTDQTQHTIAVLADELFSVAEDERIDPYKAISLGPCKVIPQEHPQIATICVDVGRELSAPDRGTRAREIVAALLDPGSPPVLAFRDGRAYRPIHRALPPTSHVQPELRADRAYLITGGTGGVGRYIANLLSSLSRIKVILLSRFAEDHTDAGRALAERIGANGSTVVLARADVSRADELFGVLARLEAEHGPITGVIHAAGLPGSGNDFLAHLSPARSMEFFAAKVSGAVNLLEYFAHRTLDFGVLISSSSAVLGGMGDCAYSSANIFLDHLALSLRRDPGSVWRSSTWDRWPTRDPDADRGPAGYGAGLADVALTEEEARAAVLAVLATPGIPCLSVAVDDFSARVAKWTHLRTPPAAPQAISPASTNDIARRVAEVWRDTLGASDSTDANFFDVGGSSFTGLRLVNKLHAMFDCKLKVLDLFENPTIDALARLIESRLGTVAAPAITPLEPHAAVAIHDHDDKVAIVGIAGRLPGADSPAALWERLIGNETTITYFHDEDIVDPTTSPSARQRTRYVPARGVVHHAESFDHLFFGYSLHESRLIDPQQRVFLECAHEAFEDAGIVPSPETGRVGVFASTSMSSYFNNYIAPAEILNTPERQAAITGNSVDSLATRVSYKLNLTGPSMTIQTFCSSSLVALHEAISSMMAGHCELALVGGSTIVMPQECGYSHATGDITASDGVVRPFDNRADGTVFSNGAAVVLLKRYKDAVRDRDNIYCVVRATAINNDGSLKAGFSAPSVAGQQAVIETALAGSGIDPRDIHFVETHGTGTKIGDPIEIEALTRAYAKHTQSRQYCALGSVKANLGHLDRAAGVTSLIKAALVIRHRLIPATINHAEPNENIDFAASPFYVNTEPVDLSAAASAITVGVTSLGFGGTNAHAILQEAVVPPPSHARFGQRIVVVSGQSQATATENAARLAAFLDTQRDIDLADVAFTLATGRRAFPYRIAIVCESVEECIEKLRRPELEGIAAKAAPTLGRVGVFRGSSAAQASFLAPLSAGESAYREIERATTTHQAADLQRAFEAWMGRLGVAVATDGENARHFRDEECAAGPYAVLAAMWVAGARVEWTALEAHTSARRVSLPTYAFQRVPCTLPLPRQVERAASAGTSTMADVMRQQLHELEQMVRDQLAVLKR